MSDRLTELFERHLFQHATEAEKQELAVLALTAENEQKLKELISQSWDMTGTEEDMPAAAAAQLLQNIFEHKQPTAVKEAMAEEAPHRISVASGQDDDAGNGRQLFRIGWKRWQRIAVAACLLVMAGIALWMLLLKDTRQQPVAKLPDVPAPNAVRATITLANGRQITLESADNGVLATEGQTAVVKEADGAIRYADSQPATGEVSYNTLFNPRGSKVAIISLADGTKVWLNTASTLRYFSSVGKGERKVELTGEAYFEVARDASRPFVVAANGINTEVLGTHFNVNRYPDEAVAQVTLLEGSIKVTRDRSTSVLKPGQQARVNHSIEVIKNADVEAAVAWKNGQFNFEDQPVANVLKQVGRWYDVDIRYEKEIPGIVFFGEIESSVSLAQMVHFLERSGVKLTMDLKKKQLIIH